MIELIEVAVFMVITLTGLNLVILLLNFKLYTEFFKQVVQEKRKP